MRVHRRTALAASDGSMELNIRAYMLKIGIFRLSGLPPEAEGSHRTNVLSSVNYAIWASKHESKQAH